MSREQVAHQRGVVVGGRERLEGHDRQGEVGQVEIYGAEVLVLDRGDRPAGGVTTAIKGEPRAANDHGFVSDRHLVARAALSAERARGQKADVKLVHVGTSWKTWIHSTDSHNYSLSSHLDLRRAELNRSQFL